MSVVFVAGVHGVGKTTGCADVSQSLGVPHATASQIIRDGKVPGIVDASKVVQDMDENQLVLILGVRQILTHSKCLLLDGHFTLRTPQGIEPIPVRVFEALSMRAIAVFYDDPVKIAARISERDKNVHHADAIRAHQDVELAHAHDVSRKLGIPIEVLDAFDAPRLARLVASWLSPQDYN